MYFIVELYAEESLIEITGPYYKEIYRIAIVACSKPVVL